MKLDQAIEFALKDGSLIVRPGYRKPCDPSKGPMILRSEDILADDWILKIAPSVRVDNETESFELEIMDWA